MDISTENKETAKRLLHYEPKDRLPEKVAERIARYENLMQSNMQAVELPNVTMAVLLAGLGEIEAPDSLPEEKAAAIVSEDPPFKIVDHGAIWRTVVNTKTGEATTPKKMRQPQADVELARCLKEVEVTV